jgi:hypothetical protein
MALSYYLNLASDCQPQHILFLVHHASHYLLFDHLLESNEIICINSLGELPNFDPSLDTYAQIDVGDQCLLAQFLRNPRPDSPVKVITAFSQSC